MFYSSLVRSCQSKLCRESHYVRASNPFLWKGSHLLVFCEDVAKPSIARIAVLPIPGGERGIRTPDTRKGIPAFQASALSHYATSPCVYPFIGKGEGVQMLVETLSSLNLQKSKNQKKPRKFLWSSFWCLFCC